MAARSTREVLEDHLALREGDRLEDDLERNYHPRVVGLSLTGEHRGHEGVRAMAAELERVVPAGSYAYDEVRVAGRVGMLIWSARSERAVIEEAADSFVVEDGLITAQTIHYHVRDAPDES